MRQLLAAYRRDDWTPSDLDALTQHLTTCAECRQLEASYRRVGENIRQLPSITPPADFRERVFAAIQADQRHIAPVVAQASRAITNPAIPVVRPAARVMRPSLVPFRPRVAFALTAAAVLLLCLISVRIFAQGGPVSLGGNAASLPTVSPFGLNLSGAHGFTRYSPGANYAAATGALATGTWLVFSTTDAAHGTMLFAVNRQTKQRTALLTAAQPGTMTIHALTDRWVIWGIGNGASDAPWSLHASRLPSTEGVADTTPLTLIDTTTRNGDTPTTLGGVSANGDIVLVAAAAASGSGILLRYDLSNNTPAATVIARSPAPGHLLTDPTIYNGSYYWADVWFDGATGLHSAIWRSDDSGHKQQVLSDQEAFHPQAVQNTLVWVEIAPQTAMTIGSGVQSVQPDDDILMLNQLSGSLQAQLLKGGQKWQISDQADVTSVQASGSILLWRGSSQMHAYDLRSRALSSVDQQVRQADFADATTSAIVWQSSITAPLYIYDVH